MVFIRWLLLDSPCCGLSLFHDFSPVFDALVLLQNEEKVGRLTVHSRLVFEHLGELCVDLVSGEDGHDADIEKTLEFALRGQCTQVFVRKQVDFDLGLGETLQHLPLTLLDIAGT